MRVKSLTRCISPSRPLLPTATLATTTTTVRRHLGSQGAKIVIIDVAEDKMKAAVEALSGEGIHAIYAAVNVADEAQWKAAVDAALAAFGRIDVLVQAAGVTGKTGAS
jgi:NADP-dependent 3-hydroxy acid dehydrogenase YdfG